MAKTFYRIYDVVNASYLATEHPSEKEALDKGIEESIQESNLDVPEFNPAEYTNEEKRTILRFMGNEIHKITNLMGE